MKVTELVSTCRDIYNFDRKNNKYIIEQVNMKIKN